MSILKKQQIEAEEKERHRIAKDLHDSLGQQLSAVKLYLNTLKGIAKNGEGKKYEPLIARSITALDDSIADLSNICFNLMPVTLKAYGLVHAVEDIARKIKLAKKVDMHIVAVPGFPALDDTMEINIFRIIQEFINNSIKHGKAKNIYIKLGYNKGKKQLDILLKDDGKGFNTRATGKNKGMGLKNIRSRVEFHKGTLVIKSNSKAGTTYKLTIPLQKHFK